MASLSNRRWGKWADGEDEYVRCERCGRAFEPLANNRKAYCTERCARKDYYGKTKAAQSARAKARRTARAEAEAETEA